MRNIFKTPELRPDQINNENQITDKKILWRDRLKFGVACIMYQSEESGLGPIHTMIVKLLGGGNIALGIVGGAGNAGSLSQCFGAILLKLFGSNKKAMNVALGFGALFGAIMGGALLLTDINAQYMKISLMIYVVASLGLAGASGIQNNIENSWIGDLVPQNYLGWFTSVKWMICSLGILGCFLLFGEIANRSPYASTFAILFGVVSLSHVVAIILMSTVTDRVPQNAGFVAGADGESITYKSLPLWCYIWFYAAWAGGRTALVAFSTAYMLSLHYSISKITVLFSIQIAINMLMLFVMGRISDRFGIRKPLIIISGLVGVCMMLWTLVPFFGIGAIITYMVINGAAGNTHTMLASNYGLEIFPAKGRAAYLGFSRVFIGLSALIASILGGVIMNAIAGWKMELLGRELNSYTLFFLLCSLLTVSCIIPLFVAGNRKVIAK